MLENIKAKLFNHLFSHESDNAPLKNNLPYNTSSIGNIAHPRKTFGITRPTPAGPPGDLHHKLPALLKTVGNPDAKHTQPVMQGQTPAARKTPQHACDTTESGSFIAQGSRGKVYRDGDNVTKVINLAPSNIKELISWQKALRHETDMCNEYWKRQNGSSPATLSENRITMPFVRGTLPTEPQTHEAIKDLYSQGLMMADASPANFMRTESGRTLPVDFGLVFPSDNTAHLDKQLKVEMVRDYIKGGYEHVPPDLRPEYATRLREMDISLGQSSPTTNMNAEDLRRAGLLA